MEDSQPTSKQGTTTEEREYCSDEKYRVGVDKLAQGIKKSGRVFDGVFGIPTGGMIIAGWLRYRLGLRIIVDPTKITRDTLIAEDIVDKGDTLQFLFEWLGFKPFVCTLYWNRQSSIKPDIYIYEKKLWVQFPPETDDSSNYGNTLQEILSHIK